MGFVVPQVRVQCCFLYPEGEGSLLFLMKLNSQSKERNFCRFAPSEIALNNLNSSEVMQLQCNQIPRIELFLLQFCDFLFVARCHIHIFSRLRESIRSISKEYFSF